MRTFCKQSTTRVQRAARAGFNLLEVMIACLVGAVIFLALFSGMSQGYNLLQYERESLRASQIIVGRIERIRLCSWGDNSGTNQSQLFNTTINPTNFTDYFYPLGLGSSSGSNVVYNGTVSIRGTNFAFYNSTNGSVTSPSYCTNMARVVVTVTWSDIHYHRTNTFTRSMATYISQYGVQNYISKD